MLSRIFKYGFFLRLYFILKNRISRWFYYLFLIIIIFYAHGEIKEVSSVINDQSLIIWSYIIKNLLLIILIIIFILKETSLLNSKRKNLKNDINQDKITNTSIESDGFDAIRKKKYLNEKK